MPRDSGGIYTLPTGNPVVSGTVIASNWANPTMTDLGTALTDSLSRTGNGGMQAPFKNINGTETAPSDTFNNDPLSGRYLFEAGDMRDTVSGVDQVRYTNAGLSVTDGEGGWVPVLGSGSGAILVQTDFTDVAGQTVFTTELANSSADCFINGSLLANDDYTFTLGNTITLVEPVQNASDIVSILGYGAFDITDPAGARDAIDVYSKEETDNGRKNYIINGDKSVNQRGFAGGQPAAGVYGYDRWKGDTLGTREEQIVENTRTINRTFTISWVGGTGTADVDIVTGLNSGDSFTLDVTGNFSVIAPTDATDVQLESGSVATPFEYVSAGDNLAACQRYYWQGKMNGGGNVFSYSGVTTSSGPGPQVSLPVTMRILPSLAIVVAPTYNSCTNNGVIGDENGIMHRLSVTLNTAYNASNGTYSADAEL